MRPSVLASNRTLSGKTMAGYPRGFRMKTVSQRSLNHQRQSGTSRDGCGLKTCGFRLQNSHDTVGVTGSSPVPPTNLNEIVVSHRCAFYLRRENPTQKGEARLKVPKKKIAKATKLFLSLGAKEVYID